MATTSRSFLVFVPTPERGIPYASQYLRVDGNPPFVLASDNCYLCRNLSEHKASATFSDADQAANIRLARW
jgi:hypothetical protein